MRRSRVLFLAFLRCIRQRGLSSDCFFLPSPDVVSGYRRRRSCRRCCPSLFLFAPRRLLKSRLRHKQRGLSLPPPPFHSACGTRISIAPAFLFLFPPLGTIIAGIRDKVSAGHSLSSFFSSFFLRWRNACPETLNLPSFSPLSFFFFFLFVQK